MLIGSPAFKGVDIAKLYKDKELGRISWPSREEVKRKMSPEAEDLIIKMLKVDPKKRLGGTLESMAELKKHPFFDGIDFEEVSKPDYTGAKVIVEKIIRTYNEYLKRKSEEKEKPQPEKPVREEKKVDLNIRGSLYLRKNMRPKNKLYFFKTHMVDNRYEIQVYKIGSDQLKESWLFDHDTIVTQKDELRLELRINTLESGKHDYKLSQMIL